jgi:hypothetical protein
LFEEKHGQPDIIQVRRVFSSGNYEIDKNAALRWESKVLTRLNVVKRSDFLNRWDNNMVPINLKGPFPFSEEDIQNKANITLRKKYGARGSASELIKEKVYATNMAKYGEKHTLNTDAVKLARKKAIVEQFGTDNPFKNHKKMAELMMERYGVTNMMHDPEVKAHHKIALENKDWTDRNNKSKKTNIEKYGTADLLNRPEIREKHKRICPFGCNDNHRYAAGNFTLHMKKVHEWTQTQIKDFKK